MNDVTRYIESHRGEFLEALMECLRIPSISVSHEHATEVQRCAEYIRLQLAGLGMHRTEVFQTRRHPIVYAEWMGAPGKPTVLVYGHYDVQPVDPLNEWLNPPFEPQVRDGDLYARGAIDDKGQVYIHLGAIEAFLKSRGNLPVNLKMMIEGEEEIGSPNLGLFLKSERRLLDADVLIISDTPMLDYGKPSICYGLRGLCYMEIEVSGPKQDLHSGALGGIVENPARALVSILEKLKDRYGRVMIPGFYRDVRPLSRQEQRRLSDLPLSESRILKITGATCFSGERGYKLLERLWARPTLDINGMTGGFTGAGTKTIIPARASAKVSMRLVPDQDPKQIADEFEKYVKRISPPGVKVRVIRHHGSKAFLQNVDDPVFDLAKTSLEKAFGKKAYYIREGGTIPFVRTIADILKKPCILLGFGLPDENAHAPNERLHLDNFYKGIHSAAYLYQNIGGRFS